MRSSSKAALFLGLAALAAPACTSILGDYDVTGGSTTTGAGGSTTTGVAASGSASSTGAGMTDCVAGDACSDPSPCTTDSCDTATGKCVHTPVADGPGPDASNKPGDCVAPTCVGGVLTPVPDDADLPDDGNNCTTDICSGGLPKHTNLEASTSCGVNQFCDGAGVCVGCTQDAQCANPGACKAASCEMQQCISSNDASGTTCGVGGGKVCDGNGTCVGCVSSSDCANGKVCIAGDCTNGCDDGVKDGTETDVDCGGACAKCAVGKMCQLDADCTSSTCIGGTCVAVPTCTDAVKNGTETDVDCGGVCATKCAVGKMCGANGDCSSNVCIGGLCKAAASCFDMIKNGTETDVDCGGSCFVNCVAGKGCTSASDCTSNKCIANICNP